MEQKNLIPYEVAKQDFQNWLDYKKVKPAMRESLQEDGNADKIIDACMAGKG